MIKKNVTMSDVARELNVSTVTVSKALGDKEGVSSELKERIKEKATEMGYRYNIASKDIKEGLTYNIGIIASKRFFGETVSFYWVMYQHIVEYLVKYNYYGILEVVTDYNEEKCEIPNAIMDNKIDGLIVLGQMSDSYIETIAQIDIPVVFLDFYGGKTKVDTVLADNFYGSYLITNYLFDMGHRDIGFVGTIRSTSSIQDRFLGYYKAVLEHGGEKRNDWIIDDRDALGGAIEYRLPSQLPTAFVCNCDQTAYHFINHLTAQGYMVPDDISVVGYDNYIFSTICQPKLTTVDVNMRKLAGDAVDVMIHKIKDQSYSAGRTLVTGSLVVRNSVKQLYL